MTKKSKLTKVKYSHHNKYGHRFNIYKCDCGVEKPISEYSVRLNVNVHTLFTRLKRGWTIERTLTEPIHVK